MAGPGRASRRRASHTSARQTPPVWRAPKGPEGLAAVPVGGGRAWPGFETTREPHVSTPDAAGVEGAGGTGGPGCGARERRRGLAGQRADAPSNTSTHQAPLVWRAPEGTGGLRGAAPNRASAPQAPPVWRAPEGPEGTGGLRGAAPSEARSPSLAGGRALRRPEHQRGHTATPAQHNETRPRPVSRPRPRHAQSAALSTAPPVIRRSCPRDPQPRHGQPRGGRRGRGTGSMTRSPGPRHGRSGSTAGRHRARHTRRA